jgi:SOS-response transcriptional repressor LexA
MRELKDAVDAAILASGKSAAQIARDIGVDENTISRVRTGAVVDPGVKLIVGIARETNTPVGALLGDSIAVSSEDEEELKRFRRWIDGKLATRDARKHPNAEVLRAPGLIPMRAADRKNEPAFEHPFGPDVRYVLRALGDSMIDDGIRPEDTLYANAADADPAVAAGRIVACRLGGEVFVKRLASEHGRRILLSANPSYLPIVIDAEDATLEIFGVVIGRIGRVS